MKTYLIGTSGYIGSRKQWLKIPNLKCLEINATFYRLPTVKSIDNYNELTKLPQHKGLVFSVKVSKYITHMKRLKNCKQGFDKFWNSIKGLNNNLKVLLFQLPPSFKYNKINLERLKKMSYIKKKNSAGEAINIVFEFRDASWFKKKDIISLFKSRGWTLGGTMIKKNKKQYWMGDLSTGLNLPEKTSDCTYLRIHGARGYRGGCSKKQLVSIKNKINKQNTQINYIIFNNVFFNNRRKTCKLSTRYAALCNANEMNLMVKTRKKKLK